MKILQLCLRVPLPPHDGATIAIYNLAESLTNAGASVKMLSFNTKKHFIADKNIPEIQKQKFDLETVFVDASVKIFPALLNLFKKDESYNIIRFDVEDFHLRLSQVLQKETYDIIQFEGLFLSPYIETARKYSNAKLVLRAHNVEWLIWKRMANAAANPIKKKYLELLTQRLRSYEQRVLNKFDALVALTPDDENLLKQEGCTMPIYVAPVGLNTSSYPDAILLQDASKIDVFHLGSMDWMPNIEGVDWFLKKVWPLVIKKTNKVTLHLAGKKMDSAYFKLSNSHLNIEGEIVNSSAFMADKQVMIVPLLSGGGMRVKIVEGLAAGKTIVSTTIGAEGIAYEHNKNLIIADTPEEFCKAIVSLVGQTVTLNKISLEAQKLARSVYDNKNIGQSVADFYNRI